MKKEKKTATRNKPAMNKKKKKTATKKKQVKKKIANK